VPAIGKAIAQSLQAEPYWKPFFDGFPPVRAWLEEVKPDIAVVFYNDHGLNFFLDNIPTFAVGAADSYRNEDEGWGIPALGKYPGDAALSWHIIESLIAQDFDPATCQRMLVDHAFAIPMQLLWPKPGTGPGGTVPIVINTVQYPLPSASRCFRLGQAVGRAIASYPEDLNVVVIGTGGLSHQLDGARAGHINKEFDRFCMQALEKEPSRLLSYTNEDLVEAAGAQGIELLMWIAARGSLGESAVMLHSNYHVPISNTAAGLLLLAPFAAPVEG